MLPSVNIRTRLARALRDQALVRLVRSPKHAATIDGFIVAVGENWTLIQGTREGGYFDGYSAFRHDDVKKIHRPDNDVTGRFAQTLPTWPPRSPQDVNLDSAASVVSSLASASDLIGIEQEEHHAAIWIGSLLRVTRKRTTLLEVRPDGTWHQNPSEHRTKDITLVSIDTMYQHALSTVAPPPGRQVRAALELE